MRKKRKQPYDDRAANAWEDYVRKRFKHELTNSDVHFLRGLRFMERKGAAFAEVVVANVPQWQSGASMSDKTIKDARVRCVSLGLIDCVPGQQLLKGAATQIRRKTIEEIETGVSDVKLREYAPVLAREVVARLQGRILNYGGHEISPAVSTSKTGRIILARPCPQIESADTRVQKILSGLKPGEYLVDVDFRQAEPSVVREVLSREGLAPAGWPDDIYQNLSSYLGQTRDDSKSLVMALINAHSSTARIKSWGIRPGHFFSDLGKALDTYKDELWKRGKQGRGHRRHVHTLGRTMVEALKGEKRMHRGKLLQWQIQGTVADIMNLALAEILDSECEFDWNLLFPMHDGVYVVVRDREHSNTLRGILEKSASRISVELEVRTELRKPEDNG